MSGRGPRQRTAVTTAVLTWTTWTRLFIISDLADRLISQ